jgi:hypothetical protein
MDRCVPSVSPREAGSGWPRTPGSSPWVLCGTGSVPDRLVTGATAGTAGQPAGPPEHPGPLPPSGRAGRLPRNHGPASFAQSRLKNIMKSFHGLSSDCPFRAKDLHGGGWRPIGVPADCGLPLGKTPVQPRVCDESGNFVTYQEKKGKIMLQFGKNAHIVNRWTVSLIETEHPNAFGQGVYHFLLLSLLTWLLFLLDQAKRVLDKVTPCGSLLCPLPSRFSGRSPATTEIGREG